MSKRFCFTLNNYTVSEESKIKKIKCKFLQFGHEIAPTTGTPHLQGYIEFKNDMTLQQVINYFNIKRTHIEQCVGSASQNIVYTGKDKDIFVKGRPSSTQGQRSDLNKIRDQIKTGSTINEIAEEFPGQYVQYHKGLTELHNALQVLFVPTFIICEENEIPEGSLYCDGSESIKMWNGEDIYIDNEYAWADKILLLWLSKSPVKIPHGYQYRTVLPKTIYVYNRGWKNLYENKDKSWVRKYLLLKNKEVPLGGNTGPLEDDWVNHRDENSYTFDYCMFD